MPTEGEGDAPAARGTVVPSPDAAREAPAAPAPKREAVPTFDTRPAASADTSSEPAAALDVKPETRIEPRPEPVAKPEPKPVFPAAGHTEQQVQPVGASSPAAAQAAVDRKRLEGRFGRYSEIMPGIIFLVVTIVLVFGLLFVMGSFKIP
ncbi:MAG: hypothetical protein ABR564_00690 [Candidatus Dormibacteria bacterium]